MIYQAIYSSAATGGLTEAALTEILAVACERNAAADITGVPVATDGLFLQVLEGPQDAVTALLAKIGRDPRHRDVTIFHQSEQDARAFTDWRMAHLSPDTKDIKRWAGQPGTATLADWRADVERKSGRLPAILGTIVEAL